MTALPKSKFAIINQHTDNYGDDCAGAAAIIAIKKYFDCDVHVFYHDRTNNGKLSMPESGLEYTEHNGYVIRRRDTIMLALKAAGYPVSNAVFSDTTNAFILAMKEMDQVFVSPCGANIGHYRDWWFLGRVLAAVAAGHTPIFHLNTLGSSGRKAFDWAAKVALNRSKLYVRESKSFNYLEKNKLSCVRGVDSAFSLPPPAEPISKANELVLVLTQLDRWFPAYQGMDSEKLFKSIAISTADFAMKHGLTVRIIPHLHGVDEESSFNKKMAQAISTLAPKVNVIVDEVYENYKTYEKRLAEATFVITMRYHGMVLSAKNRTPFAAISYEYKMDEAADYCGVSRFCLSVDQLTDSNFSRILADLHNLKDDVIAGLAKRSEYLRQLSELPSISLSIEQNAASFKN